MYKYYFILSHYSIRQIFSFIFILSIFLCGGCHDSIYSGNIDIKSQGTEVGFKSIFVTEHDTLWSIAKENYTQEYCGSLNDYIKEIKRCNSLISNYINAGSSLVVPIYTPKEQSYSDI